MPVQRTVKGIPLDVPDRELPDTTWHAHFLSIDYHRARKMATKEQNQETKDENAKRSKQTTLDSLTGVDATTRKTTGKGGRKRAKKAGKKKSTRSAVETERKQTLLEKYQKNLAIYRDMGYKEGEAETHILVGREYLKGCNLSRAEFHVTKGRELYEELDLVEELADAFELMGDVKGEMDSEAAVDDYRNALKFFGELEDTRRKRTILTKMAGVFSQHGQHKEALARLLEAQDIQRTNSIVLAIGCCHENI